MHERRRRPFTLILAASCHSAHHTVPLCTSPMQSIRPCVRRLARPACSPTVVSSWARPSHRPNSTFSPARGALSTSRANSHADEANKSAILKRPRKLPPGAPTSQLFLDLLQISPVRARPQLINEDSARALVRAWGVDKMHDVTVVDAYSGTAKPRLAAAASQPSLTRTVFSPSTGPGGLAKAYLELPNVKRVICIEDAYRYRPFLDVSPVRSTLLAQSLSRGLACS